MRRSDLIARRELHRLDLYREVYRPLGVESRIAITLASVVDRVPGVALSRAKRDFSGAEHDPLNLVRPHLIQTHRNALAHTALSTGGSRRTAPLDLQALGLSQRQTEVPSLVAMGHSYEHFRICVRTAQKYLERCYRALDVSNHSQASRLAWGSALP
jgi:hypothetical protein